MAKMPAQKFHRFVLDRQPPLRLAVGADKTEAVSADKNLPLRPFLDLCKGSEADDQLVREIAACFLDSQYTWAIDPAGLLKLFETSVKAALDDNGFEKVVLNVGFGGSEEGVPLRALAYTLPLLETAKRLKSINPNFAPTIRLFTGQMMAAYCLGKDINLLWTNTATLFALVRSFVKRFYPNLEGQLVFDFDRPIQGDLEKSLVKLRGVFSRRANGDQTVDEALAILEGMASGHGADLKGTPLESARLYGAGHPTAFGDFDWEESAHTRFLERTRKQNLVMVGWGTRAETKFWRVRRALTGQASEVLSKVTPRQWVMMFTQIGYDKPPYYRHPQGDLNWSAVLNWHSDWGTLPDSVRSELRLLASCAGGVNSLIDWTHSQHCLFAEVENTGIYAEELLAHGLLGCPVITNEVTQAGLNPSDDKDIATWAGSLDTNDEKSLVAHARKFQMAI